MPGESEYSRRQREQLQRILRSVMPDVQRKMREIGRQTSQRALGDLFTPMHEKLVRDLARRPAIEVSVPALKLDYQALFPDFANVEAEVLRQLQPSIEAIQQVQRRQFAGVIARARRALIESLPPNWPHGDEVTIPENLEALLLDEGLPLAWVPPNATLLKVFEASSPGERRKALGSRWRSVAQACVAELGAIDDDELAEFVGFALEAAESLLDGKSSSSQALSANLLDSIPRDVQHQGQTGDHRTEEAPRHRRLPATRRHRAWRHLGLPRRVLARKVPNQFSRHGSAHAVSRRQYSRINALIALMHVVALLKVIEIDFTE